MGKVKIKKESNGITFFGLNVNVRFEMVEVVRLEGVKANSKNFLIKLELILINFKNIIRVKVAGVS